METKKTEVSLELTDPKGDQQPSESGSYVRKDGELVLVETTKNPDPFGGDTRFIEPESEAAVEQPVIAEELSADDELLVQEAIDEVVAAIALVDSTNHSLWTKESGPKLSALEELVGHAVTADMRTAAWEIFTTAQES